MKIAKLLRTPAAYSIIASMLFVSVQTPAMADVVGTIELAMQAELQIQRNDVRDLIAREDVRAGLRGYGVNPVDIDKRIDNLTSSELLQIQNKLAALPAGADGVLGAVLTIILIFVLLDVLGATDVFPRI